MITVQEILKNQYVYSDIYTVTAQTYAVVPLPVPDEKFKNCTFSISFWNQSENYEIYIKFGNVKISLPPRSSFTLESLTYQTIQHEIFAYATSPASLSVTVTGEEKHYIINNLEEKLNELRKSDTT